MNKLSNKLLKHSKMFIEKNASTILTCLGVVGVVGTSVSSIKSYKKYTAKICELEDIKGDELTTKEKINVAIPSYAPTIFIITSTIGCIIGSNVLNKQKQASLLSAYMTLDASYKEYRSKIVDLYGQETDDKIIMDMYKHDLDEDEIYVGEKLTFFEPVTRTYFEASMGEVQQAEYLLNRELVLTDYARINDFLRYLGQEETDVGDIIGWSSFGVHETYGNCWIDFKHEKTILEDGFECYIIRYPQEPRMDYLDF